LQCKTIGRIKFERNRKLTTPIFDHSIILQRKLFISSLQKISTQAEVDIRKAELERAFRKYGGARGVTCIVPTNTTFAFVEMENERMADLALSEMSEKYRLNRARRSRHEALQEKRADAEAAKAGKSEDTGGWWGDDILFCFLMGSLHQEMKKEWLLLLQNRNQLSLIQVSCNATISLQFVRMMA
jgi:RNA recognition motif-containing protein